MTSPAVPPVLHGIAVPIDVDRLAAVSSIVDVVERHVGDLAVIPAGELTAWLDTLVLPAGWQVGPTGSGNLPVARLALWRAPSGDWGACQTISVFRFTGTVAGDVVESSADCTLNDLGATGVFTAVAPPPPPGIAAVRSSGYVHLGARPVWVRYETYLSGCDGEGRLIQHSTFVRPDVRNRLSRDLGTLTDTVHRSFLTLIGDDLQEPKWLAYKPTSASQSQTGVNNSTRQSASPTAGPDSVGAESLHWTSHE
jgi:hypothetical protein